SIESRKIDMLRTNPAVCMEVDEYDPGNWCSVVIWRECTPRAHLLRGRFGGRQRRQERASADALRGAASHTSSSTAGLQRCPRLALRWLEEETARRGGERRAVLLRGRCVFGGPYGIRTETSLVLLSVGVRALIWRNRRLPSILLVTGMVKAA